MIDGLIIDDNSATANALKKMLEGLGVSARAAYGSKPAMEALSAFTPRFILLDINMSGVDGFEILAYIKREPRLMKTPVFIVTSDDQPETRQRALRGGAVAVLIKPARLELLEGVLKDAGLLK
ncbi:MAG: hypothetical protein Fur002_09230 [Anaerolineales bacterium]